MSTAITAPAGLNRWRHPASSLIPLPIRLLHFCISAPAALFLLALAAMLFRPPDLKAFPVDRIAFAVLMCAIGFRICLRRERLRVFPATWPMLALLVLGLVSVLTQPYDAQAWSLLAAKWIVPFALFHVAGFVFNDGGSLRKFELFSLMILGYLTAVSIFFLLGADSLIYPRFILDESIGIHTDRARGPFLQAVANGVCLNVLGLIALDSFRRGRLRGPLAAFLFFAVPGALLATKTRAVWLSAAISIAYLAMFCTNRKIRHAAIALCVLAAAGFCVFFLSQNNSSSLRDRLADRSPLEFRSEMYQAGWQMLLDKPLTGWGNDAEVQPEIAKRVRHFRPDFYVFHNTYLELAVQRGVLGLGLYAWLIVCLFRLGKAQTGLPTGAPYFLDTQFRKLWPLMLGVYLLNASVVVMNYQFVNAFLFTIAGILGAQNATEACQARSQI